MRARRVPLALATGFGSGLAPVVPGTVGTLAAVPVHLALATLLPPAAFIGFAIAFVGVAIWVSGIAGRHYASGDPPQVVVDEWAGYFLTVAGHGTEWKAVALGFVLFRLFDILKPFPARRLERLPGGAGIVLDDVMAGIYGNLVLWLALTYF